MPDTTESRPSEDDWTTWPDGELMARLLRRNVEPVAAKGLVRDRAMPEAIEEIKEALDLVFYDADDNAVRLETSLDRRARR